METIDKRIRIISIKNGLILGAVLTTLEILSFYFITQGPISPVLFILVPMLFSIIIPIATVTLICFNVRKKIGGYWSLRQATTGIFIMFIIAYAIRTAGRDFIFAKIIEPNMVQKTEVSFLKANAYIKKQAGASVQQLLASEVEIKKEFEDQKNVPIGNTVQGIFISIILVFVLALIFGALFKREPPVYSNVINESL